MKASTGHGLSWFKCILIYAIGLSVVFAIILTAYGPLPMPDNPHILALPVTLLDALVEQLQVIPVGLVWFGMCLLFLGLLAIVNAAVRYGEHKGRRAAALDHGLMYETTRAACLEAFKSAGLSPAKSAASRHEVAASLEG